jgi:polyvinyl alcohol dehydrogenase (cytochrome)
MRYLILSATVLATLTWASAAPARAQQAPNGAALYRENCASCHDAGADRAPSRDSLQAMSPEAVLAAMESGLMVTMASRIGTIERRAVAEFITGKPFSAPLSLKPSPQAMCAGAPGAFNASSGPLWNGWGQNDANSRFQDSAAAGIAAADVGRLKVKWAFGFPGDQSAYAQPAIVGGRVFVGSPAGIVYALSAATGCINWYFEAERAVRTAVMIGRVRTASGPKDAAFFGDQGGTAYALDAATGALLWKTKVEDFPGSRVTGSPVVHNGRLFVPVASGEETAGAAPDYQCCRSRGSLVALDAATGKQVWKTYMIQEEPLPTRKSATGTQLWGPSGASIWNSPTIDVRRNALYVGTGNNFSDPPTRTSDAIVAMDLTTGKVRWSRQMTAADAWTVACRLPDKSNCAEANGPDFDFSSSPILVTMANGRRMLVAGQKSGMVHGLDPDADGKVIWSVKVGEGGTMGGVQWGSAADRSNAYVALSDIGRITLPNTLATNADPKRGGGIFALRVDNGQRVWYTPPPGCGDKPRCSPAQSAAVSAIPGVAFSGAVDGHLRGYSTTNGAILWDVDTAGPYQTVNGVPARGGSLNGPGPAIAGGMLFTNSGYVNAGGMPGNVLLAFSVDGK